MSSDKAMSGTDPSRTCVFTIVSRNYLHFALNAAPPAKVQKAIKQADREAAYHEAVHLAGFEVEEARKFFGEPSLAAFDLERFDELIRPWPTREAHDRFVDAVDMLATAIHSQS